MLHFPLRGPWLVAQGRREHHCLGRQFGFDLIRKEDARVLVPDLTRFVSFGQPVFSPATGKVWDCTDQNEDIPATPGCPSGEGVGNWVVIEEEGGAFVFMAHLLKGSLRVRKGEGIEVGQQLAEVGNSGTTSQPHLHVEVLDGAPDLDRMGSQDFTASGLPFGFHQCRRIGQSRTAAN